MRREEALDRPGNNRDLGHRRCARWNTRRRCRQIWHHVRHWVSQLNSTYRLLTLRDVPAIASLEVANADHIGRFLPRPITDPQAAIRKWCQAVVDDERGLTSHAVLLHDGEIVGACFITHWPAPSLRGLIPDEPRTRELVAWVAQGHSSAGIGTAIISQLRDVAFGTLDLLSVVSRVPRTNPRSIALARKGGFVEDTSLSIQGCVLMRLNRTAP